MKKRVVGVMERLKNEKLLMGGSREPTKTEMEKYPDAETEERRDEWRKGRKQRRYKRTTRLTVRKVV